ncbi:MAG TPA: chemotaxis protein CheA, partial [Caulobacteraceae bacterium]|nr:chemotaxis protein CheA [Caulobacteraceae bacterium]
GQLTRDIQESVMAIRAQPVKAVFQRMARLVREAEAATGKRVRLVVEGESTEVDRTVIEQLTEPLTHMVRNAVAHGLESPERRSALGKPPEGLVRISAAHRGGRIVIEVADDGQGLDRSRVRAMAVERGVIAEDAVLADEDVDNLIFAPGFSTATSVSDLSGRGVGLDVVRRGVQALGGRISVSSLAGVGSTFSLSLPLTLAVLDGMLVSVAGHGLVVPLTSLIETVQPRPADVRRLGANTSLLSIHGAHVPLIDLGRALGYPGPDEEAAHRVALLVEDDAGEQAALMVDEVLGQRQVVIKSLEANYRPVDGVAAATILGDGRVALILDIAAVIAAERRRGEHANVAA